MRGGAGTPCLQATPKRAFCTRGGEVFNSPGSYPGDRRLESVPAQPTMRLQCSSYPYSSPSQSVLRPSCRDEQQNPCALHMYALVAQMVEQWICNPKAARSNRAGGTNICKLSRCVGMVDIGVLKTPSDRSAGSSPATGTNLSKRMPEPRRSPEASRPTGPARIKAEQGGQ